MDQEPPPDKWNLVYLTLTLHGLGTITAFNMFITAKSYFEDYKLAGTPYKENYMVFIGWACQIPNLIFSWFNIFVHIRGDLSYRIVWALVFEVFIFVLTICLAMMDTSESPACFFWTTMILVLVMNGLNAIFQNSVYGVGARLPQKYTGAVVLGSNICGTLVALLSMTTQLVGSARTAAIYYFIGGMTVLLICFDTYFALPLNRFYRYHDTLQKQMTCNNPALAASNPPEPAIPYATIFKQSAVQLYNIILIFIVSLSVFPAVLSSIKMSDSDFFLGKNFMSVGCFLTFNFTAMIGNLTANRWPFPGPKWLWVFSTVRIAFIPFFLLCNYEVEGRTMPILITNDWIYWLGGTLLGWSSGHGSSLGMMYVSGTVAPKYASKAGMIGGATLVTGIVIGITLGGLGPMVVKLGLWKAGTVPARHDGPARGVSHRRKRECCKKLLVDSEPVLGSWGLIDADPNESALRQFKNLASPVTSFTKDLVLSPLTKLAKGVQTLGANLDPRKIKGSTAVKHISEQQYEEHKKLQEKWKECNTRLVVL